MYQRRWELLFWPQREHWHWRIRTKFGKFKPFLRETWLGPFCFRRWADSRSATRGPVTVARPARMIDLMDFLVKERQVNG